MAVPHHDDTPNKQVSRTPRPWTPLTLRALQACGGTPLRFAGFWFQLEVFGAIMLSVATLGVLAGPAVLCWALLAGSVLGAAMVTAFYRRQALRRAGPCRPLRRPRATGCRGPRACGRTQPGRPAGRWPAAGGSARRRRGGRSRPAGPWPQRGQEPRRSTGDHLQQEAVHPADGLSADVGQLVTAVRHQPAAPPARHRRRPGPSPGCTRRRPRPSTHRWRRSCGPHHCAAIAQVTDGSPAGRCALLGEFAGIQDAMTRACTTCSPPTPARKPASYGPPQRRSGCSTATTPTAEGSVLAE
jgi:hypothetical protein